MKRPADIADNLLGPESTLLEAVQRLDAVRRKLVLVVDEERRLLGTLSDGDVRRALMRQADMQGPVSSVMTTEPVVLTAGGSEAETVRRLAERGWSLAPIVDRRGRVIGLYPDALPSSAEREELVVIMAGGRGARLAPLTQNTPKPMLKVAGRPLLETIVERLQAQGFRRFRLAVNYLAEVIEDHFGDGAAMGVEIEYLREDHPRGTAGALSLLRERPERPLLVMNGDVLTRVDFGELLRFHADLDAAASLCVREQTFQAPHGVVEADGPRLTSLREKPTFRWLANAGIYGLSPEALDRVPAEGPFDMPELLAALADRGEVVGVYPIHEYWLDIGQPPDFELAQSEARRLYG